MGIHCDFKWLGEISHHLRNYKELEQHKAQFSCPFCGDSKKSKWKARGSMFVNKGITIFHCYNCSVSKPFGKFIKEIDEASWRQWQAETRLDEPTFSLAPVAKMVSQKKNTYDHMTSILHLPPEHDAWVYIRARQIPQVRYHLFFYAENFKSLVDEVFPGKAERYQEEARLVLPFYNQHKELVGVTGRSLNGSRLRYSTARSDDQKCFYGLERMDTSKPVFVVEGPMDSLFLPNSIAVCNADLDAFPRVHKFVNSILIFDNEPLNMEVVKLMTKAIDEGRRLCIWAEAPFKGKDINEFILNGATIRDVVKFILEHSYKDTQAKLKMNEWRKLA